MYSFMQSQPWSFSLLTGFLFFIFLASAFNHRKMNKVHDKTVPILTIVVSLLCGVVVTLFVNVLVNIIL